MIQRNEAKILVPIISAYAEGRILQYKEEEGWRDIEDSEGLSIKTIIEEAENYRIKPKYRPFANAEECWTEMQKHQPFGWIKGKEGEHRSLITSIIADEEEVYINGISGFVLDEIMEHYTFADGLPFGVKLEE
jgi:hypothetical protein